MLLLGLLVRCLPSFAHQLVECIGVGLAHCLHSFLCVPFGGRSFAFALAVHAVPKFIIALLEVSFEVRAPALIITNVMTVAARSECLDVRGQILTDFDLA